VIIATPDFWHADHTVACLEAGLHVYCEKEMSNSLEGARRIVEAARKTDRVVQIGHQRRSNPRYLHCVQLLLKEAQLLGRITTATAQWNRSVQPDIGSPKKYEMDPEYLQNFGYENMHQFLNWRWYKRLGGGPIVDLGSHQIDIFNWFLCARPDSVLASGGIDYYDRSNHEWYDNVMAIYEYQTDTGPVRAYYQTLTTNSNQGYFEQFLGDQGSLYISESAGRAGVFREPSAPFWDQWVERGFLVAPRQRAFLETTSVLDVRETMPPPKHSIPVVLSDPYHQPHLENFFSAIRGLEKPTCPPAVGFETAVTVLRVNEAVEAGRKLPFDRRSFHVA
jgi:predicted dehydrogenase